MQILNKLQERQTSNKKRRMMKSLRHFWLFIFLLPACGQNKVKPAEEDITRVKVIPVAYEKLIIPVHSAGIVASTEEMKLSFKTGGIIAKIYVKEGDKVHEGDVLAALNLSEIKASEDMAENGYEKAYRDWQRAKNLYSDTVATLEQYQNATTALEIAKSNLAIARFNLAHSTITAPDDGVILKQLSKANEITAPGYPVFLFGSAGKYWKVKGGLSDRDVVRVNPGDSAVVTLDAYPGISFPAVVELVSGMSNPMTGTYEVEFYLDGMGNKIIAGMIAGTDIFPAAGDSSVKLPVGAVVDAGPNGGYIYAVNDSGIAVRYRITIKAMLGSEISVEGIPEGIHEVVSEGTAYLHDGMKVQVIR